MTDQQQLKEALIAAFDQLKQQGALLAAVMAEVAAIREAVFENDLERLVRYQELLAVEVTKTIPQIAAATQALDAIIRLLSDGVDLRMN